VAASLVMTTFRSSRHSAQGPHRERAHARGKICREDVTGVLNRAILIGRMAVDPRLSYTHNGVAATTVRLSRDRPLKNQQGERETDFFGIVTWRKLAEVCAHNLGKGRLVAVEGRLQTRSYQAQDGSTRWI